jgi:hypothetical protein
MRFKPTIRPLVLVIASLTSLLLVGCGVGGACYGGFSGNACSSSGSGSNGLGNSNPTGPYTIGGTVTGLVSGNTGLVLQDNAADNLTIAGNGTFTFKTAIATGKPFDVSVFTPPSNPPQTCTVANGNGNAIANVNTVQITCSTGTVSIGGNVIGLLGKGLVLQDNGGDDLPIPLTGAFTFKTALPIGTAYAVTVSTQPTSPSQTCTVTYGSGTANANVGNIQITCSTGTLSIGGTVSGLATEGSGLVLQDDGGDNLVVRANGTFTFPTLIPSGGSYSATILSQPTGPNQTCTVTGGSGTTTVNITGIQIICPAVLHTIGGTIVGLVGNNADMVLTDNGGDNLVVNSNGPFTFNTPIADGSSYDVSILQAPNTQPGVGIVKWFWQGTATADVTSVVIDCGHNDWAWFDGGSTANSNGAFTAPPLPPPATPAFDTDTPGGRMFPATWTDSNGNLWLFGGFGLTYFPDLTPPATKLNDMWEYTGTQNYYGGYYNYWNNFIPATSPSPRDGAATWTLPGSGGNLILFGGEDREDRFMNEMWSYNISGDTWTLLSGGSDEPGVYGTQGHPAAGNIPGSRWGATARIDASGTNVWLFGGYGYDSNGTIGLLNDLWTYNTNTNQWTWVAGSKFANVTGSYGTIKVSNGSANFPGGRQQAMSWIDLSGNFWLFGGFDLDSTGNPDALNDLWEYSGGVWTWMSGANVVNQKGVYGTEGVAAAANVPGARWSSAAWTDHNGALWLFGGEGFDSAGNGSLADLWEYTGGQWIWVKGPASVNQAGVYGLSPGPIIYPYVGNGPGSRFGSGYWIDGKNQFWMFGGEGFDSTGGSGDGLLDDLWRYLPYP